LGKGLTCRALWFVIVGTIASVIVYGHFYFSQVGLLLSAVLLLGYTFHQAGKLLPACLMIASAGLIKLFPFILLPWVIIVSNAQFRKKAIAAFLTVVYIAIVILWSGTTAWRFYFESFISSTTAYSFNKVYNFSIPSLIFALYFSITSFDISSFESNLWRLLSITVSFGLLLFSYAVALKKSSNSNVHFSLLLVTMLMINPTAWGHYFVFLIFPFVLMVARILASNSNSGVIFASLIYLCLNNQTPLNISFINDNIYIKIFFTYMPLWGLIGLWIFFVIDIVGKKCATKRVL
jgi:hypothetical protein